MCRTRFEPHGGDARELPGKIDVTMNAGDVLHYWTTGGAGREAASTRDPQRVLEDVLDGRVSVARARDTYLTVIGGGHLETDTTASLRRTTPGAPQIP